MRDVDDEIRTPIRTPDSRFVINNDHEGDVECVARKDQAFNLAQRWADEDGIAYCVIDRMAHQGRQSLWTFSPNTRQPDEPQAAEPA
jgi:hypothetical protein